MAEQTFKSPNFYEREIDLSAPSLTGPTGVPAAIIGTANKGPAFVPVTVANFNEFVQTFGNLDPKHAGPYAANEFLKHRSALTYLRVLGTGANETDEDISDALNLGVVKNAGFFLSGAAEASSTDKRNPGVVQFLTAKHTVSTKSTYGIPSIFNDNDTLTAGNVNLVRGVLMTPKEARIMVLPYTSYASSLGASTKDSAAVSDGKFKLVISSSLGAAFSVADGTTGVRVLTASMDPTSKDYFGKILNTDPDRFYLDQHYLHADFAVDANVANVENASYVAVLSGSSNVSANGEASRFFRDAYGSYNTRYTTPVTPSFISQPFGTTEYDLFHFEALDDGEYANRLYKISISNVRASTNDAYKYGTFNVQIRDWNDTDTALNVIEQFSNCSLDPSAPNYVAKMIGDRKVFYNFDSTNPEEKRLVATGKYDNASKYVRIIMNSAIDRGQVPSNALPFGFRGPSLLNLNPMVKDTDVLSPSNSRLGGYLDTSALPLTASFLPPIPFRFKVTRGEVAQTGQVGNPGPTEQTNVAYYWGVKFERASTSSAKESDDVLNANVVGEKNNLLASYTKFLGIKKLDVLHTGTAVDVVNNNKFSLANVILSATEISDLTASTNSHMRETAYVRNAVLDSTSYKWTDGASSRISLATLLNVGTAAQYNRFSSFAKFTTFMYGGFDGTNFLNRDARRLNDKSLSFDSNAGDAVKGGAASGYLPSGFATNPSGEGVNNNGVKSFTTAIDIMTNPMEANNNILVIPGIKEPYITDYTMKKVRDYGLAFYIMDIPSYDDSANRLYDDSDAKPNIIRTTSQFDDRAIDNNYGGTYYPDVFIDDLTNRRKVKVPASVAALGALAYNDRVSYPWFAPAGFNRAALDFVTNVDVRLNVTDRDRLYESRVNPIASFPRLGFVIYGQKTLQINKTALDRVNVRRLLLEIKRIIIGIAQRIVFEQNTPAVRNKFVADASFQLGLIQAQAGVEAFQVICNESNNTQADADLNKLNGRIVVVPTRVVEYIAIDFIITNSGVQFV